MLCTLLREIYNKCIFVADVSQMSGPAFKQVDSCLDKSIVEKQNNTNAKKKDIRKRKKKHRWYLCLNYHGY